MGEEEQNDDNQEEEEKNTLQLDENFIEERKKSETPKLQLGIDLDRTSDEHISENEVKLPQLDFKNQKRTFLKSLAFDNQEMQIALPKD